MKKYIFCILALFFLYACNTETPSSSEKDVPIDIEEAKPQPVAELLRTNKHLQVGMLSQKTLDKTIQCTGQLQAPPTQIQVVHSRSGGYIRQLRHTEGDYVSKGAVLLRVEQPNLLDSQRELLETKAALQLAQKDFQRQQELQAGGATTAKAFDESLANKERLLATYNGYRKKLELLNIDVQKLENEHFFQSELAITAPQEGHIQAIHIRPGQMVHPEDALMTLVSHGQMLLRLDVYSKDVASIRKGQKVAFRLPNDDMEYTAEVLQWNPMLDAASATLSVRCRLTSKMPQNLQSGVFVNATIALGTEKVHGLPAEAVVKEGEDYYAYVVEDGFFVKKMLTNVRIVNNFVTFDTFPYTQILTKGAYYVE